jgi:kynurenine 3-monooxygenase
LFAPTSEFERLSSREAISEWFSHYFPDAFFLIGEEKLIEDFERNPRGALISIKVR